MKLYPRICSNCGRRFVGKKMDYTCPICIENMPITVEGRDLRNSEFGQIMRIETRGQPVIGCHAAAHIHHS